MNSIQKNPLYKVGSKRRVAHLLGFKRASLEKIARELRKKDSSLHYSVRTATTGGKTRIVEQPLGIVRKIHDRLHAILRRIEKPNYVFSGKKGISHLHVGRYHLGNTEFLTLDIRKFFASTQREYLFRFFHYQMENSADISWFLTDLICFEGHLPLGSPVSQDLAFLVFRTLFDKIAQKASERNQKFSLYVDDMTFSSREQINPAQATEVNYYLRRSNLTLHPRRTKIYRATQHKLITGTAITRDQKLKVPNRLRRKISAMIRGKGPEDIPNGPEVQTLIGRITAGRQIEPDFFGGLLKRLRETKSPKPVSHQS